MSEANVLVIEDEAKLSELLLQNLSAQFEVEGCPSYAELERLMERPALGFDVVVLDRMMNGRDTLALIDVFKERFPQCRILVLSAINTPAEKAVALDHGADDYLSKPFAWEELIARIRSLVRRGSRTIRFGNISLDTVDRVAKIGERDVTLSNKEFLLLRAFVQSPGKVFSKQTLFEQVWNMSSEVESNAIETTITKLRRKLEEAEAAPQIRNSRNLGYWLEE